MSVKKITNINQMQSGAHLALCLWLSSIIILSNSAFTNDRKSIRIRLEDMLSEPFPSCASQLEKNAWLAKRAKWTCASPTKNDSAAFASDRPSYWNSTIKKCTPYPDDTVQFLDDKTRGGPSNGDLLERVQCQHTIVTCPHSVCSQWCNTSGNGGCGMMLAPETDARINHHLCDCAGCNGCASRSDTALSHTSLSNLIVDPNDFCGKGTESIERPLRNEMITFCAAHPICDGTCPTSGNRVCDDGGVNMSPQTCGHGSDCLYGDCSVRFQRCKTDADCHPDHPYCVRSECLKPSECNTDTDCDSDHPHCVRSECSKPSR